MKCQDCGTEMKPLATSMYCPNDCDRKVEEEIDPEKTPQMIFWQDKPFTSSKEIRYRPTPGCTTGSCDTDPPTDVITMDGEDTDEWNWIDNMTLDTD